MKKIKSTIEGQFSIKLGVEKKSFIDKDMPDQEFYEFENFVVILVDYFSDNEIEKFFPKIIKQKFNKEVKKYLRSKEDEICFMTEFGWVIVAEI